MPPPPSASTNTVTVQADWQNREFVQAVQHLETLADGVCVWAESLVWQGLPRLKLENLGLRVEGAQGCRGFFGLAASRDHHQLQRGELLGSAKIADCLDDAGLCANRGDDICSSICDFRLQSGERVTLNCEVLKSFERDKACEGLRVCRAHVGKSTCALRNRLGRLFGVNRVHRLEHTFGDDLFDGIGR
jgi:hypothetical protein